MARSMTILEIGQQYQDQWVLVVDPVTDTALELQGGSVAWHSGDREEVYRKAIELHPPRFAVLFVGEMPDDTAIVL
jgi:hypothetical protein